MGVQREGAAMRALRCRGGRHAAAVATWAKRLSKGRVRHLKPPAPVLLHTLVCRRAPTTSRAMPLTASPSSGAGEQALRVAAAVLCVLAAGLSAVVLAATC